MKKKSQLKPKSGFQTNSHVPMHTQMSRSSIPAQKFKFFTLPQNLGTKNLASSTLLQSFTNKSALH